MIKQIFPSIVLLLTIQSCAPKQSPVNGNFDITQFERNNSILSPRQFGAIFNDSKDDSHAFQKMFDFIENNKSQCYRVEIPPGKYNINHTVTLPSTASCDALYINGYGATILNNSNDIALFRDGSGKANINSYRLVIDGITIEGNGSGTGLKINASYTCQVSNCHFISLDYGIVSLFSLNGFYNNLRFTNINKVSFYGGYGDWPGASKTNSCFNANLIQNCRVFGKSGQEAHFKIIAGDNNKIFNCISEGRSPKYNVLIDSENSTVVNHYINIENFWIESSPSESDTGSTYFEFRNIRGLSRLQDVQAFPAAQKSTLINNPNSQSHTMIIIDGYRGSCHRINNNASPYGTFYHIKNTQPVPAKMFPFSKKENWVGGIVPIGLIEEQYRSQNSGEFNTSTKIYRNSNK